MHYHRAEYCIVVEVAGKFTCGNEARLLEEYQSTDFLIGTCHRLEKPGVNELRIIEE